jgi:hypothetical protein
MRALSFVLLVMLVLVITDLADARRRKKKKNKDKKTPNPTSPSPCQAHAAREGCEKEVIESCEWVESTFVIPPDLETEYTFSYGCHAYSEHFCDLTQGTALEQLFQCGSRIGKCRYVRYKQVES